jgi:hypothetical protein
MVLRRALPACLWLLLLLSAIPSQAKPPTGVKSAIVREESPVAGKDTLVLPYAFSTESLGFTTGIGGGASGYGQEQLIFGATLFGSSDGASGTVLGIWDYCLPFAKRIFFSAIGSLGQYPRQRVYSALAFEPGKPRAGSNESEGGDYVETPGSDNWLDFRLDLVLPLGAADSSGLVTYKLKRGMRTSAPTGGRIWNPMTSGVTLLTLRQYNRYQLFETDVQRFERTIHPLEAGVLHDNTDFPVNPSFGSSQYLSYIHDFGWLASNSHWNFVQFEASKYFSLGESQRARQRVLALNLWTGHSPSWNEKPDAEGNTVAVNRPPHYDGATLGGFYRMKGYPAHRFNDRSVLYTAAEYRYTPHWHPLGDVPWLRFMKMDWWQFVGFIEGGRVANGYTTDLLRDWKTDVGFGIRALVAGALVRIDVGFSNEEVDGWVMVGHPF